MNIYGIGKFCKKKFPREWAERINTPIAAGTLGAKLLTNYIDEGSIMYYPQKRVKGDSNKDLEFKLSSGDVTGAVTVYGQSGKDFNEFWK